MGDLQLMSRIAQALNGEHVNDGRGGVRLYEMDLEFRHAKNEAEGWHNEVLIAKFTGTENEFIRIRAAIGAPSLESYILENMETPTKGRIPELYELIDDQTELKRRFDDGKKYNGCTEQIIHSIKRVDYKKI